MLEYKNVLDVETLGWLSASLKHRDVMLREKAGDGTWCLKLGLDGA